MLYVYVKLGSILKGVAIKVARSNKKGFLILNTQQIWEAKKLIKPFYAQGVWFTYFEENGSFSETLCMSWKIKKTYK